MTETPQASQVRHRFPRAENCSFHGSREHVTMHCWALKKYLKNLVQRGYLDEFILDLEEDPEVGEAPAETVD